MKRSARDSVLAAAKKNDNFDQSSMNHNNNLESLQKRIPSDGVYVVSSCNNYGRVCNKTLLLHFTKCENVNGLSFWMIHGEGNSIDASKTTIRQGLVAPCGKSYWVEARENVSYDTGNDVVPETLSTGKFNFANSTFVGKWQERYGPSGHYISFHKKDAFKQDFSCADRMNTANHGDSLIESNNLKTNLLRTDNKSIV